MNAHPNTHPNAEAAPQADGQHDECSVFAWPGLFARIDPADEDLTGYRWYSQSRPTGDYVWRREARTRRKIYLAREIAERAGGLIEGHDVDHINGDGAAHRRETRKRSGASMYALLIREGFPPGFQVLCFNCNFAKRTGNACPHAEIVKTRLTSNGTASLRRTF